MKIDPKDLKPWTVYRLFEGGGVYTAERDGHYFVITDESTLQWMLPDEDLDPLVRNRVFQTEAERAEYLLGRYGPPRSYD